MQNIDKTRSHKNTFDFHKKNKKKIIEHNIFS